MELPVDNSPLSTAPALDGEAGEQTTGMRNRITLKCIPLVARVPKKVKNEKHSFPEASRWGSSSGDGFHILNDNFSETSRGPIIARREKSHILGMKFIPEE